MRATIDNAATATKPKTWRREWDYSALRASPLRGRPSGVIPLLFVTYRSAATGSQALNNNSMAERVGFEPTNTREDVTGIPVQRLRPLGHLSDQALARIFSKASSSHPAGRAVLARARMIHRHACGGVCFGTLKGGGSSRQRSFLLRGGGAGVFSAGMCKALAVSGVSSPGGIFRGAMLADLI